MKTPRYVSIATKAYQQACKYNIHIPKEYREKLFYFIHDWWLMIEDNHTALENGEETPDDMFKRFMNSLNSSEEKK